MSTRLPSVLVLSTAVRFGLVLLLIVLGCLTAYRGELLTFLDLIFTQMYSPFLIAENIVQLLDQNDLLNVLINFLNVIQILGNGPNV